MSGDEFYDDDVTSGPILPRPVQRKAQPVEKPACWWCEDWAEGFDPEPCPEHQA